MPILQIAGGWNSDSAPKRYIEDSVVSKVAIADMMGFNKENEDPLLGKRHRDGNDDDDDIMATRRPVYHNCTFHYASPPPSSSSSSSSATARTVNDPSLVIDFGAFQG